MEDGNTASYKYMEIYMKKGMFFWWLKRGLQATDSCGFFEKYF